eukprot:GHVU01084874.1.p1 GENE.GHVU01084874.1~~GHVU01084874.1.p1  ORF type:complete len:245 (+),score=55.99 GHVU01084874.1:83-736(+)
MKTGAPPTAAAQRSWWRQLQAAMRYLRTGSTSPPPCQFEDRRARTDVAGVAAAAAAGPLTVFTDATGFVYSRTSSQRGGGGRVGDCGDVVSSQGGEPADSGAAKAPRSATKAAKAKSGVKASTVPTRRELTVAMQKNDALYEKILCFDCVTVDEVVKALQAGVPSGKKVSKGGARTWLEQQGICFAIPSSAASQSYAGPGREWNTKKKTSPSSQAAS